MSPPERKKAKSTRCLAATRKSARWWTFSRRRKNNPILVGEPGVGKTALVEGLALRIAEGNVPDR
jgi:ATP-dependent Clp protease ATP-binding subunit ClpA